METNNKKASLEAKKAFVAKSRRANYRASLLLEGIQSPSSSRHGYESKAAVIARYQVPESIIS